MDDLPRTAASTRPWPPTPDAAVELVRQTAEVFREQLAIVLPEINEAMLSAVDVEVVTADPVLRAAAVRSSRNLVEHWLSEVSVDPHRPVAPRLGDEDLVVARELVRRGLNSLVLDSYRAAQSAVLLRWIGTVYSLGKEAETVQPALELSVRSIDTFLESTIAAVHEQMERERSSLVHGSQAERREVVALLLEGAPIESARASARLGYGLDRLHRGVIVWDAGSRPDPEVLDQAAAATVRALGGARPLTVIGGASTTWVWVPVRSARPPDRDLRVSLRALGDVGVAVGRPLRGRDGFRRSHLDALALQRMVARLESPVPLITYEDAELGDLLSQDLERAEDFVRSTLGDLASASALVRGSVLAYVECRCNAVRAAERLHVHRNTLIRNLARADELLPVPLEENVLRVAVALELLRWLRPERA